MNICRFREGPAPVALAPRPLNPAAGRTTPSRRERLAKEGARDQAPEAGAPGPTPQVRAERAFGSGASGLAVSSRVGGGGGGGN